MVKREVKPFIDVVIRDTIYKFSYVTGISVKTFCEDLCNHAFKKGLGAELSPYFKRSLNIDGILFMGNQNAERFEVLSKNNERISMTLNINAYEYAYTLSYAIGCSVARIITYAVEKSMNDTQFLNRYISRFLNKKVNKEKKDLMANIIKVANKTDPNEEYSMLSLLLYIGDEYRRLDDGVSSVLNDVYF